VLNIKKFLGLLCILVYAQVYSQCTTDCEIKFNPGFNPVLPTTGCNASTTPFDIAIVNVSPFPYQGDVTIKYGFDTNNPFVDTVFNFNMLPAAGSVLYPITLDSACGSGDLYVWIEATCDLNTNDDTTVFSSVTIDCPALAGTINAPPVACSGDTLQLDLIGYTGNITSWDYSTDGGATWSSNPTSAATDSIFNITQ
jgi:hypothetical protein